MEHVDQYKKELQNAVLKTVTEKYIIPLDEIKLLGKHRPLFSSENNETLYLLFQKLFSEPDGTFDISKIKGQCLKCHSKMAEIIEKKIGIKPILTVGYVIYKNQEMFKFNSITDDTIRKNKENKSNVVNIHVWLTLPSFEIIDFTFIAHLVYVNATDDRKKMYEKATDFIFNFGSADLLYAENEIIYHPQYVGKDILLKNGFLLQSH